LAVEKFPRKKKNASALKETIPKKKSMKGPKTPKAGLILFWAVTFYCGWATLLSTGAGPQRDLPTLKTGVLMLW
jgi:hypothetical protein